MKHVRTALIVIVALVFGYMLLGEFLLPANVPDSGILCEELPNKWVRVSEDGTRTPFAVPGRTDGDITLETTLPETLDKDVTALWFRGMDMEIYVDGELREKYAVEDYALFGDRSAECYVMASVYPGDAGKTLLGIINDILDVNKIESGSFEIIPVDYDTASILNDVLNITRPKAAEKDLEYRFNVAEDIPSTLHGDEIRIRQIMLNLVNNAVKYTKEGFVDVAVSSRAIKSGECELTVRVSDSGVGIRDEDRSKLFKSFQRLDEKKNRSIEGTGLGLHITYLLTQMMGGRIDVESEYGKGSVFTVTLPQQVVRRKPIGDFSRAVGKYLKDAAAEETTLYAPDAHVLVVDDNEMNLEVIEGLLRDTKIRLELAASGKACIEKAKRHKYDCILLDQMMPEMSGTETLRELERLHLADGTPVIALTADAVVGAKESYLAMGFTDYLSKPVKYEKLEQALKKHLPAEKQLAPRAADEELPVMLVWGDDPPRLKEEKERLAGIYKCVCVTGVEAKERYLKKHRPDGVLHVTPRAAETGEEA